MKNPLFLAFWFLILLVSSCKKDNEDQPPVSPASPLINTITFTDTTGTYYVASRTFQYDAQGRVTQMIFDHPTYIDSLVYKYEYQSNMVISKIYYSDHRKYGKIIYSLNSDGLAVSETDIVYDQNGDSSLVQTTTYKYENGYMTEKKDFRGGDTSAWISLNWQVVNGNNMALTLGLSEWGGTTVSETYEYYPGSVNTLGNSNRGMKFLGKSSTNLVKSSFKNTSTPEQGSYSYTFDPENRVVNEYIRGAGIVANTGNVSYTYY